MFFGKPFCHLEGCLKQLQGGKEIARMFSDILHI